MKKNRFISFLTAFSLSLAALVGIVPAQAAGESAVEKGFKLEYNKEASTATTRVIDVYMVGIENFFTSEMGFAVPSDVTKASFAFDITKDVNEDAMFNGGNLANGKVKYTMVAVDYVALDGTTKVGTITLTVNEGTPDFDVVLSGEEIHDKEDENVTEGVDLSKTKITITDPTASEPTEPTATPTAAPTATPTAAPTATPTAAPTATPTAAPTTTPTAAPTATPTAAPTATPTVAPVTVDNGFKLEYNKEASTATTRVIDVYMVGIENFFTSEMEFAVPSDVTKASFAFDITKDVNEDTPRNC